MKTFMMIAAVLAVSACGVAPEELLPDAGVQLDAVADAGVDAGNQTAVADSGFCCSESCGNFDPTYNCCPDGTPRGPYGSCSTVPPLKCGPQAPQCCVDGGSKPAECGP